MTETTDAPADYELVPLTEQDAADIAEAQATALHVMGDPRAPRTAVAHFETLSRILVDHGFDPFDLVNGTDAQGALTLWSRRAVVHEDRPR